VQLTNSGTAGASALDVTYNVRALCPLQETFAVSEADARGRRPLPRDKYPRPLLFHDGRLAFLPTPPAALAMYTFLPFGIALVVFRTLAFSFLPYRVCFPVGALTGMHYLLVAGGHAAPQGHGGDGGGRLYVCNHRTLLDPIVVAAALGKAVTAVTYSLSPVSEMIAPIRTARLTRDREQDRRNMAALLARGNLVVCPEGTTCREEYLLRFSPLFGELGADVNPVALDTRVDMFYGTSTKPGAKWMDPFYFMMNPRPAYRVEFQPCAAAENGDDSIGVANRVQRELGEALGFELTGLTRKDKYMMLAGNEGVVPAAPSMF
jgi:glycerol-3-phosphate acyltransferase